MKVVVTCGPSYEPIDQVQRLTNFSTCELGVHLSNQLTRAGFEVFCLKGGGATHPGPGEQCHLSLFDTNDDPLELLRQASSQATLVQCRCNRSVGAVAKSFPRMNTPIPVRKWRAFSLFAELEGCGIGERVRAEEARRAYRL